MADLKAKIVWDENVCRDPVFVLNSTGETRRNTNFVDVVGLNTFHTTSSSLLV